MYGKFFSFYKSEEKNVNLLVLVELKNGDTFNGRLLKMDGFLNLLMEKVVITNKNGNFFFETDCIYVKGETVKYLRLP